MNAAGDSSRRCPVARNHRRAVGWGWIGEALALNDPTLTPPGARSWSAEGYAEFGMTRVMPSVW